MTLQKNILAVRLIAGLIRFGSWLQSLVNNLIPPPFRLVQIGSVFWQSRALYVAVRLDIAGVLGEETLTADAIAERVEANADSIYRLLRMLAAMEVFTEDRPRRFRNNRLSTYLKADHPHNVRAMILMHNSPEMSRPWLEQLEQGLRSGNVPFELAHGQPLYDYMNEHADFDGLFADAMDSVEALSGDSFAVDFDWGRFQRIIDIGGSKGSKSLAILKRHPQLSALVFDRLTVIDDAAEHWAGRVDPELLSRMTFQAGDMTQAVPHAHNDRDIYLLSAILHGMADADCIRVLRNLAEASAGTGARVAILELVVPESHADLACASCDMQMLMATCGRERTLSEWQALFAESGWSLEETVSLHSLGSILVLRQHGLE